MSLLARYTDFAKRMSDASLIYAIADIKAAWKANADWQQTDHPYGEKLWAEWDAYTVEIHNRRKAK
jgi:hypothetical protein